MKQLSNGINIIRAMAVFASQADDSRFPELRDPDNLDTRFKDSNEAMTFLLTKGLIDDKKVFFNEHSAWCKERKAEKGDEKKVLAGECDWAYVRGLTFGADARLPVLANAFAPGTKTYVADPAKPEGVWQGEKAVVIYAGGNGEIIETKKKGEALFVPRPDKPDLSAFEPEKDVWLDQKGIEVLLPLNP